MAPKNKTNYYQQQQQHVQGVALPQMIKCKTCEKSKVTVRYSQRQLNEYRSNIARFGQMTNKFPNCKECTGGNREELKCHTCEYVKSLEHFTKQQLKKNDLAVCKDCQQDIDDRVPDVDDALVEEEIREEIESGRSTTASMSQAYSMTGSLPSVSNRVSTSGSRPSAANSVVDSDENGVWVTGDPDPGRGPVAAARRKLSNTANSPSPTQTRSVISGSSVSANSKMTADSMRSSTWGDFTPPDRIRQFSGNQAASRISRGSNPGFVSLRAPPRDPVVKVKNQILKEEKKRREEEEQVMRKADSDDDDDDDDWEL